ncbi:intradiol ring-cleavage dioxygenase [Actinobacteria bacterium OK074]|nr:intradiol ring-cleavage dioxygenase [Actinobacteria bacterium OK074]
MSRRKVLLAGGAGIAAVGLGGTHLINANESEAGTSDSVAAVSPSLSASDDVLPLTKEATEGPYYIDYDKDRVDITEGKKGTPLDLRIQVRNAQDGKPVSGAAVDVWQCDALGIYSGYEKTSAEHSLNAGDYPGLPFVTREPGDTYKTVGGLHLPPDSKTTYLRGFQMTDDDGWVRFRTIVPGWYTGRTPHIHAKVHTLGVFRDGAYADGTTAHTGQLYFPQDLIYAITKVYTDNTNELTTNAVDTIMTGTKTVDGMLTIKWDKDDAARPMKASIRMAIEPDVENLGHTGIRIPTASPSS